MRSRAPCTRAPYYIRTGDFLSGGSTAGRTRAARLKRTSAPTLSGHSEEVLRKGSLSDAEISELRDAGVLGQAARRLTARTRTRPRVAS